MIKIIQKISILIKAFFLNKVKNNLFNNNAYLLMKYFKVDEYGHEANLDNADLGYGWIHYGFIRQQKPKRILCVGSRHGYIPAILAQACKDNGFGRVDFVDASYDVDEKGSWTGVGYWHTNQGKKCFDNFGLGQYITLFVMKNSTFNEKYKNNFYDYIYIDGDHSLKGVILDFKLFWPKLNKRGFMAFHDICVKEVKPEGIYGVWKFWELIQKKMKGISVNFLGSGLGIIQKK